MTRRLWPALLSFVTGAALTAGIACGDLTGDPAGGTSTPREALAPTSSPVEESPRAGPRLGFVEIQHLLSGVLADGIHLGDPEAPVHVTVYGDFQCRPCRRFAVEAMAGLIQDFVKPGRLYLTFLPLVGLRSPESRFSAQAALCAADQDLFWRYVEVLYNNQGPLNSGAFGPAALKRMATEVGIEATAFADCLDSGRYLSVVEHMTTSAQLDGVLTLPTFDIAGVRYGGFSGYAAMSQRIVDAANR